MPTPFVRNGVLIETFGYCAPGFTDSDCSLTEATKQLGEVNIPQTQPFLQLCTTCEMNKMTGRILSDRRESSSDLAELLYLYGESFSITRRHWNKRDRARGRLYARRAKLRSLVLHWITIEIADQRTLIPIARVIQTPRCCMRHNTAMQLHWEQQSFNRDCFR